VLFWVGADKWRAYCLDGATSVPTSPITMAKHHSVVLLGRDTRKWSKCYSSGKMSTPKNQMGVAEHHSGGLTIITMGE